MLLKPLKRETLESSPSTEVVEPATGTSTAFIRKLQEFPKVGPDADRVESHYFAGLRVLICLYDHGKPFLPQLVNSLNESDPVLWPTTVMGDESIRSTLDALDAAYLIRVIDHFIDVLPTSQMEEINNVIRTKVWVEKDTAKN